MKSIIAKQPIFFFLSFLFFSQVLSQTSDPLLSFSYFPSDLSLNCSDEVPSVIDYPIVLLDTANTDCNDILTLSFDDIVVDGGCPNSYIVERVWSAGICGETISDIQIFSFLDTISPTIISPVDGSHVCETDPAMSLFPAAQDNCQLTVLLNFELVETVICEGITKRDYTITASDSCGNTTTETRSVYIHDIAPPTFLSVPIDQTLSCTESVNLESATYDCSIGITYTEGANVSFPDCSGSFVQTQTYSLTDMCASTTNASRVITVVDDIPPILYAPEDFVVSCPDVPVLEFATAFDECSNEIINVIEVVDTVISNCGLFTLVRTFSATDDCGNTSTAIQTITVTDTTPPVFSFIPSDLSFDCADEIPSDEELGMAIASDECSEVIITVSEVITSAVCPLTYLRERIFTAVDSCGNSVSATQTITVTDNTPPQIVVSSDTVYAECGDNLVNNLPDIIDDCSEFTVSTSVSYLPEGTCPGQAISTFTYTVTDACGNVNSAIKTVVITDNSPPIFLSIPPDTVLSCESDIPLDLPTHSDVCSSSTLTETQSEVLGECLGERIVTRTFTITDLCGNSDISQQTVSFVDSTSPVLTIPEDYTAECSDAHPMDDASATDNCGEVTIDVVETTLAGACAGDYTITREFTATDDCGNATSATQTITIVDTTSPEFTFVPADYTAECSDVHPMDDASATDNCGEVTIDVEETTLPGACAGDYTITREFTATDDCGNATSATQTITIIDTTSPELTIPLDYTAECSDAHPMDAASATDNCGEVTIDVVETTLPGACAGDYTITREFTATDDCGNATSATQTITIVDTTAPVFTSVPADYTAECSDVHPMDDASATDNCGEVTIDVVETSTPGACAGDYTITRSFTATDDCGNATSATQTITIVDTTAPIFTISPPTLIEVFWVDGDIISMPVAEIDDNCDSAPSMSVSESSTTDESPGSDLAQTITYVYLATDDCQNSSTFTSTLIYYPQIMGCTDATACNYNPVANDEDGSCLYYDVFGICDGENSLQAAIDATIAASLDGGSNILSVPSGTYNPVSIPSSIELQAEAGATIDASGFLIGISISGPSVTIDGLTITGDGSTVAGIEIVSGADNAVIRNCDISGMALANPSNGSPLSYGILCYQNDVNISPVSGTLIEGNTIHNVAGAAISLATNGAVGVQISQNTFSYISPVFFEGEFISIGVQAVSTSDLNVFDNSFDMVVGATSILLSTAVNVYDNSYSGVTALHVETTSDDAAFSCDSYWARAEVDIPGNINVLRVYFANLDGDLSNPGAFTFANDGSVVVDSNGETYVQDCNGVWDGPGIMTFCGCDIFDEDDDGVCPVDEVAGCTDLEACNFNPLATDEDGSCTEDPIGFDCDGNLVPNEFCGSGTVWNSETGTCEVIFLGPACYFDTNFNGAVDSGDLLNLLSAYGLPCE